MVGDFQEVENQKLRAELQAANIQLAALEAVPPQNNSSPQSVDELLATWKLEEWRHDESDTWYLLDSPADAVYLQGSGQAWPHPVGHLVSVSDGDSQIPYHSVSDLMDLVSRALAAKDWSRCVCSRVQLIAAINHSPFSLHLLSRTIDSVMRGEASDVNKSEALAALKQAVMSSDTDMKESTLSNKLDTVLDVIQLFHTHNLPRGQFEAGLKEHVQLYMELSQNKLSSASDMTLVRPCGSQSSNMQ